MADVNISKFRASVNRPGSAPAAPGFAVSEGQNPVEPSGTSQDHLPVTIAPVSTGLAITEAQVLSGAGTVGQYIRGDGSLADFPASTGGGSSVSYYLNGSVSQGTIGGVAYRELNKAPVFGAGTDISINADGYIASFITDANDPNLLEIPGGNFNLETYFSASSNGGSPSFYAELYKYNGTTFTLIASSASTPELIAFGTNIHAYFSTLAVPTTVLAPTDRLAIRYYVNHSGRTITLHTENNHLCQVITTFTTGLTALNGLTDQVQFFQVGTAGTNFNISSVSPTHTFNLPSASASNRGALTSADWTTFNNKENAITAGTTAQYFRGDKTFQTLNTAIVPELTNLYYTEARVNANTNVAANTAARHNAVTLGTANGLGLTGQVLSLGLASAGVTGALSGTDWSTFNSKQNALTNPVTGTGTAGQVAYFNGINTITSESGLLWDASNNILGINTITPDSISKLDVNGQAFVARLAVYDNNGTPTLGTSPMFYSPASGTLAISTNASLRMLISNTGNVQIGSVTPTNSRLLVSGTHVSGHSILGVVPVGNNTATIGLYNSLVVRKVLLYADTGFVRLETDSDLLQLLSAGNLGVSIFTNGRVFVGGSPSDSGFQFDVNGTGRFNGTLTANTTTITNNTRSWIISPSGASINHEFAGVIEGKIDPSSGGNSWLGATSGTTGSGAKYYFAGTGAATFASTVTASSFIRVGGTSIEFLKADGSVDFTTYVPVGRTITINGTTQDLSANRTFNVGTVTSVTASSPLASSAGSTPNITIQQASGSQNGFLSSTDWTTFNNKAPSVLGGYLPLSGGTLTGPLNGTSASFKVSTDRNLATRFDTQIALSAQSDSGAPESLRIYADTFRLFTATTAVGLTERFSISNLGSATFTSSLRVNDVMSLGNDGTFGSNYKTLGFTGNTTGTHRIFAGTSDDMYFAAATGRGFEFRANGGGVGNLNIISNGRVGIGTTSPATFLHVAGTSTKVLTGLFHTCIQDSTTMGAGVGGGITFMGYKTAQSAQEAFAGIDGFKENASAGNAAGAFRILTQPASGAGLVEQIRITSLGNVEIATGSIKTGNPTGSTARPFKVGSVVAAITNTFNGTVLKMEINGVVYDIMISSPPL